MTLNHYDDAWPMSLGLISIIPHDGIKIGLRSLKDNNFYASKSTMPPGQPMSWNPYDDA